jgi:hypothetical protein
MEVPARLAGHFRLAAPRRTAWSSPSSITLAHPSPEGKRTGMDALFIGQSNEFFELFADLANDADNARRSD